MMKCVSLINMLNTPRFNVFVDPRPVDYPILKLYHPPAHQEQLIQHLIQNGFSPLVNAVRQPESNEVREMFGILLLDNGEMMRCDEYDESEKILCIQWYNEAVSIEDLNVILSYCAPFYGIGEHKSYVTMHEQELIDAGFMTPVPPTRLLRAPTFLGNVIRAE